MDKLNIAIIWQGRSDRDIHGKNLKSEKNPPMITHRQPLSRVTYSRARSICRECL